MTIEIVPFRADLIPEAGRLLALRHQQDHAALPDLPGRFRDTETAAKAVEAVFNKPFASGVAALDGNRLVGYMVGALQLEAIWGRSAWVRSPGFAIAPDQDLDLYGHLYAHLGEIWLRQYGCFDHYIVSPVADPALLNAWFMLGFAAQQVHALQSVPTDLFNDAVLPPGVEIRHAGPQDKDLLADMSDVIWRHQIEAPVWGPMLPESIPDQREGWAELAEDPTVGVFLAFYQGQPVGMQGYYPAEPTNDAIIIPERTAHFTVAGTREIARGLGIQRALFRRALGWLRENHFQYIETDWRATNLLARRSWPALGYRPVAYRLTRHIDQRILWGRGL